MRYSIEPRERIYVKEYGFLSFAKSNAFISVYFRIRGKRPTCSNRASCLGNTS